MHPLSGTSDRPMLRFFAVCRDNGDRREADRRGGWMLADWRAWLAAADAASFRAFGQAEVVRELLARDASAAEIGRVTSGDVASVRVQQRDDAEREARRARLRTAPQNGQRAGSVVPIYANDDDVPLEFR